ncbi:MAG: ATP-binding protein [Candidatus Xenobia bacterium]
MAEEARRVSEEAERELARRTVLGAFSHSLVWALASFTTAYHREHPVLVYSFGLILLVLGVVRLRLGLTRSGPPVYRATTAAVTTWSLFATLTLLLYHEQSPGVLVTLMSSMLGAAATAALASNHRYLTRIVLILMLPLIIAGTPHMTPPLVIYTVWLVAIGHQQHRAYISTLQARHRAEEVAEALRVAQARRLESQKMEAVGRLAGGVAHDFNNLLTDIMGQCSLLRERMPELAELEEIQKSARMAAELTSQLLGFGRRQILTPTVFRPNDLVTATSRLLQRLVGEQIAVKLELDPFTQLVEADFNRLQQVLLNLALNARDAMPDGGTLTLITANRGMVPPHAGVVLAVRDTGTGIAPEIRDKIFEPFFTTKGTGQGTGLGLSMVYGLVEQSGGQVEVSSEAGVGSEFRVVLPAIVTALPPVVQRQVGDVSGHETVLVAEDQASVRRLITRLLSGRGYLVLDAVDGAHALARLAELKGTVDLLVTDMVMPGMSGQELARRVRAHSPNARVVIISGYTTETVDLDRNVVFLPKPFLPQQLLQTVRSVLDTP